MEVTKYLSIEDHLNKMIHMYSKTFKKNKIESHSILFSFFKNPIAEHYGLIFILHK